MAVVRTRILQGFDDPSFGRDDWNALLRTGPTDHPFLTWEYQRAWRESCGVGELLLIVAERDGKVVALAPFFTDSDMIYFQGTDFESDCLDFIGDISDPDVLDALLDTARSRVPEFEGFRLYFVPDSSQTGTRLAAAAERLGLSCYEEGVEARPLLDIARNPDAALAATRKKQILRYERLFQKEGTFEVTHLRDGTAILPHLNDFFDQHIARWAGTRNPSRFEIPAVRRLFERLTHLAAESGWLRFTRLDWQGRSIAMHYGFCYQGRYIWGIPSFVMDIASRSPGLVLLRHLLLAAIDEGAHTFDFRTGDQSFKMRFATETTTLRTWGMYMHSPAATPSVTQGDVVRC